MTPPRRLIPTLSVLVALTALLVGLLVTLHRRRTHPLSETITQLPPNGEPGHQFLLPKLQERTVVIPDRPCTPHEGYVPGVPPPEGISRRRSFHVSTNSIGLRGPEIDVPAQRPRVVCAGDSVTFGWGVAYEESWPYQLGQVLDWSPVSAAWPGAHVLDLADWIEAHAAEVDADIVLVAWGPAMEDESLHRYLRRLEEVQEHIAPIRMAMVLPPTGTFDPTGARNAQDLYPRLPAIVGFMPVFDVTPSFRAALPLPGVIGDVTGEVQRMIRLPGNEVVVEISAPAPDPEFGQLLAPEILAAFESSPSVKEPLFFDEGHPDAEGFVIFSRVVAEWLRQIGWVDWAEAQHAGEAPAPQGAPQGG